MQAQVQIKVGDQFIHSCGDICEVVSIDRATGNIDMVVVGPQGAGPVFVVTPKELNLFFSPRIAKNSNPLRPIGAPQGAMSTYVPYPPDMNMNITKPLPPGESNEFFGVSMTNLIKCTCGINSIGGGKHSDWCDKH